MCVELRSVCVGTYIHGPHSIHTAFEYAIFLSGFSENTLCLIPKD